MMTDLLEHDAHGTLPDLSDVNSPVSDPNGQIGAVSRSRRYSETFDPDMPSPAELPTRMSLTTDDVFQPDDVEVGWENKGEVYPPEAWKRKAGSIANITLVQYLSTRPKLVNN